MAATVKRDWRLTYPGEVEVWTTITVPEAVPISVVDFGVVELNHCFAPRGKLTKHLGGALGFYLGDLRVRRCCGDGESVHHRP